MTQLDDFEIQKAETPESPTRERPLTWQRLWKLGSLLLLCLLSLMVGSHSRELNEVSLNQITEMGCPYNEAAFFLAEGKRFEIGDSVRLEGEPGIITNITREGSWVNHHEYSTQRVVVA